jgi:membrane protease subunit HflK
MPWNQPGGDNKDPWGGGGGNRKGPPDLDEVFKKLSDKLSGFGKKKGNNGDSGGSGGSGRAGIAGLMGLAILGFIIWAASGFYIVSEGERGIVLRFGKYQAVTNPGPHWHIPTPFETIEMVDMEQVREFTHRATMLTEDENIVDIELAVQFLINDPVNFLFRVRSPEETLRDAVQAALREAVGKREMDYVLKEGRSQVSADTKAVTQAMLDMYKSGLLVTTVNMQQSQAPDEVQGAFFDAIKAREDNVRFVNEAEAYSNGVIPQARGAAARILEEATAYEAKISARSEGDASRFSQLLTEYEKAPDVTRKRLYMETVESVMSSSSKVLVDTKSGNSLMYLPLDKIIQQGKAPAQSQSQDESMNSGNTVQSGQTNNRPSRGSRESR